MTEIEQDSQIVQVQETLPAIIRMADEIEITGAGPQASAVVILGDLKKMLDTIEDRRKFYTVPLNDILKGINQKAKDISAPILGADSTVRRKLVGYQQDQERKAREAEEIRRREQAERQAEIERLNRKAEEAKKTATKEKYEEKIAEVAAQAFTPEVKVESTVGGVSFKKRWTFEVMEPMAIPRKYLAPDEKAIRTAVRDGERDIPGVRIFQETDTSVRR